MDESDLDAVIDDVAREMTAGEPDAALRARILERIDAGSAARDLALNRWRPAVAALAAAAAIVVAVVIFRSQSGSRITETPVAQAPAVSSAPPAAEARMWRPPAAGPSRVAHDQVRLKPDTTQTVGTYRQTFAAGYDQTSEVDALAPPPLDVPSIAIAELPAPESIGLDQLQAITPIAVSPLGADDQGEPR